MLFAFAWTPSPYARDTVIKQFMANGGMPQDGVKLLSRYHNLDSAVGFAVVESSDPTALADWALDWNGLIEKK